MPDDATTPVAAEDHANTLVHGGEKGLAELIASLDDPDSSALVAAALGVRDEHLAHMTARAEYAEGQLSARRDHETRWETERAAREKAEARVAELENALNWQTSCLACAKMLDSSIADHDRAEAAEAQVAALREELETAHEERDAARLVSKGCTMGQYDALDIYREHRRFHPSPFADCQACRMGVAISRALPSRPDDPEEIRRLAQATESTEESHE